MRKMTGNFTGAAVQWHRQGSPVVAKSRFKKKTWYNRENGGRVMRGFTLRKPGRR
jgi:hypothetical protein